MNLHQHSNVRGTFVNLDNERFYKIENVDQMDPFFISVVSSDDHWLFAASNGGLTAGRVSPETALFPYVTVDKIYESTPHTGCLTIIKIKQADQWINWQPFSQAIQHDFELQRNIYKNTLGNKLCFEEINHSLGLAFRYTWNNSREYGFCRQVRVENLTEQSIELEVVDGLINILPAGTPRFTQTQSSNLVDAYKFSELDQSTGAGMFTLYSGITDRAEPCESLKANVVHTLGLDPTHILLSTRQVNRFVQHQSLTTETQCRGVRGAYLTCSTMQLPASSAKTWELVADVEQDQGQLVALLDQLREPDLVRRSLNESINKDSNDLALIMASSDGFQATAEELVSVHHYANTLFNVLRGGIFSQQYELSSQDLANTIKEFNRAVYHRHEDFFASLPNTLSVVSLAQQVASMNDPQLQRLAMEYLPITFGRRHGDPSRPWNQFAINLKDDRGNPLLSYQGNWRDIFQNWEALTFSYPQFIENVIAKFVNASTVDGYNPYRITKQGIDWEVEEPDDPWSYIGYWGDHQIIYLLKLLELSQQFHPQKLQSLLDQPLFSYANVPYRIKPFEDMLENAKSTVVYDQPLAEKIEQRVAQMGADGKLVLDAQGNVYQVNLLEKLLIPLLSKLSNLVLGGGIWLNTQRPEWNDANNALVGQGLSMVTLYYLRRYALFLQTLISDHAQSVSLSQEVLNWFTETAQIYQRMVQAFASGTVSAEQRFEFLQQLGTAASDYRATVYRQEGFGCTATLELSQIEQLLSSALQCIDHCISSNRQQNGLYHAYNLLNLSADTVVVNHLYPMLEGQVAVLSSGAIKGQQAIEVIESLFDSDIYRADQQTFMLYPDKSQTPFLAKNCIEPQRIDTAPVLKDMLACGDRRLIYRDPRGVYRFNAELKNAGDVASRLQVMQQDYALSLPSQTAAILAIYEQVFNHQSFTGRSGGMFGFEGLGSIYWHMVSKLLLATMEQYFEAIKDKQSSDTISRLAQLYYKIREGIGFNKTPQEYGAFPTDPYSHTPKHAGAQQPGMTGQVKEEVLTRFGELGLRVTDGQVHFSPSLLRAQEFCLEATEFRYVDVRGKWQVIEIPQQSIGFTWCQVPIVYTLVEDTNEAMTVVFNKGKSILENSLRLSKVLSEEVFSRTGTVKRIDVQLPRAILFNA